MWKGNPHPHVSNIGGVFVLSPGTPLVCHVIDVGEIGPKLHQQYDSNDNMTIILFTVLFQDIRRYIQTNKYLCRLNRTVVSQDGMDNTQTDSISGIFTVQVVPPRHITLPPTSSGKPPKEGSIVQFLIFTRGYVTILSVLDTI